MMSNTDLGIGPSAKSQAFPRIPPLEFQFALSLTSARSAVLVKQHNSDNLWAEPTLSSNLD